MTFSNVSFGDVTDNFDKKRIPLSAAQREKRQGKYRYYGAQGVIDWVDDYIFDGTYLLIAEDGENLKSKKSNIAQLASGKFWVNNHAHVIQCKKGYDIRYLCYLINLTDLSGYITGSAQPKLSQSSMNAIVLPMPKFEIQKEVADFIEKFDKKIQINEKINDNLQQQAFAAFDNLVANAENTDCNVSDYAFLNPKRALAKNQMARSIDMSRLSTSRAFPSGWEMKPFAGGMRFTNGDTLLARITPCLENGKTAFIDFLDGGEVAFGSTEYIVLAPKNDTPPEMLYCLARNPAFIDYAVKNMNGSSGRQRVSAETVGQYRLPLFDKHSLSIFREVVSPMFLKMRYNSLENMRLAELRDELLPKLMSGEIGVSNIRL
ncbi:restriction endonuclease subunit S [Faecalibacterium duncaniae]|uniref:restriction endonuclease subunit S n=1 Tax=Faecalibacterium duncaniae (strain DSM 17677 / JCM 31915 / A2-165) TaxID=411483 RepID=UPI0029402DB6|nr:restriction endonuclease subunit S [Faecalibacterium duncaniae]MDV5050128.1 restriction endonuclease subunit S [Faecalibacterium duncaniae]